MGGLNSLPNLQTLGLAWCNKITGGGIEKLKEVGKNYEDKYNEMFKQAEEKEEKGSSEEAEELIKQI